MIRIQREIKGAGTKGGRKRGGRESESRKDSVEETKGRKDSGVRDCSMPLQVVVQSLRSAQIEPIWYELN